MNHLARLVCLAALLGLALVPSACSTKTEKKKSDSGAKTDQEDAVRSARESLGTSTQPTHVRSALYLLSPYMGTAEVQSKLLLPPERIDFFKKQAYLMPDELKVVESSTFLPLDAHYVEGCFLFRDAARTIERLGLTPAEQAQQALHWVCRYVFLDGSQGFSWLPPQAILRRGYGSAHDRVLVALNLLQQLRIPACLLDGPYPLLGVLLAGEKGLSILDPTLDQAVSAPGGKGIAIFEQIQTQPELLKPATVHADQVKKFKAILNTPLSALGKRMRILEEVLQETDPVVLFVDADDLHDKISDVVKIPVQAGNAAASSANSPTRMLWRFLPEAEGGIDNGSAWTSFQFSLIPVGPVVRHMRVMKLTSPFLHLEAQKTLLNKATELFTKFVVEPREMLLHGQEPILRLDRIRQVLQVEDFASVDPKLFDDELKFWREKANQAYQARQSGDSEGSTQVGSVWGDQYLMQLVQVEGEQNDPRKYPKTVLTFILLKATKEALGKQTAFLQAATSQEKAEKLQAIADHLKAGGKDAKSAQSKAQAAWSDSWSFWRKYVDGNAMNIAGVQLRIDQLGARGAPQFEVDNLQLILQDWSTSCFTRMNLARAHALRGKTDEARATLEKLAEELAAWQTDAELAKDLAQYQEKIRQLPSSPFRDAQERALPLFRPGSTLLTDLQNNVQARLARLKNS